MNIGQFFNTYMPDGDNLVPTDADFGVSRGMSIWRGIFMGVMNFPRHVLKGIWEAVKVLLHGAFAIVAILFIIALSTILQIFILPIMSVVLSIRMGLRRSIVTMEELSRK